MPQIPQYKPSVSSSTPELQRLDPVAAGAFGRDIAQFGESISQVSQKVKAHDELVESSSLAANAATLDASTQDQWRKFKAQADPTSPDYHNLASDFLEKVVQPNADAMAENLTTERAKLEHQEMSAKFVAKWRDITNADQAELTGQAVMNNEVTTQNLTTSNVFNDPSTFQDGISTAEQQADRLRKAGVSEPKIAEMETKFKTGLAQSAVRGMAHLNPDKAQADLDSGKFDQYLNGDQKSELTDYIHGQKDAKQRDQREQDAENRRKELEKSKDDASAIIKKMPIDQRGHMQIYPGAFSDAQNIKDESVQKSTIDFLRSVQAQSERAQSVTDDPVTKQDLLRRIFLPDGDPQRVTLQQLQDAVSSEHLSTRTFDKLRTYLDGTSDPAYRAQHSEFLKQLQGLRQFITKSNPFTGTGDPLGDQKWGEFQADMLDKFTREFKSGKSRDQIYQEAQKLIDSYRPYKNGDEALRSITKDPFAPKQPLPAGPMVDTNNPNVPHLGFPPVPGAAPAKPAPLNLTVGGKPARLPGESPDAFLKRTGG